MGLAMRSFVDFSMYHESHHPEDVSAALQLTPVRSWRGGDRALSDGSPLPSSGWTYSTDHVVPEPSTVADHLSAFVETIRPLNDALASLIQRGWTGRITLFISSSEWTTEFEIPALLLARLGAGSLPFSVVCQHVL